MDKTTANLIPGILFLAVFICILFILHRYKMDSIRRKLCFLSFAAVFLAGLAVAWQWTENITMDDFQVVVYQNTHYKVFSYGFPFQVNDGNHVLNDVIDPPPGETNLRLILNFQFFFLVFVVLLWMITQGVESWKKRKTIERADQMNAPDREKRRPSA
ncbi:MAG: hypothetical protein GY754_03105 [bacterium]|nr:hypothetical protein [bacterium]